MSNVLFQYKTIDIPVKEALVKIKGSKFYGLLYPISTEEEVKEKLLETQLLYPQATHYCYAFRIGITGSIYRINDDGEPSGTAGLPIYNQILSSELTDVLLVVVRYFGGTKLGVSGLIKAYKESAQFTIEQSNIVIKELSETYELIFDYSNQSHVMTLLKKLNIETTSFNFTNKCNLIVLIPLKKKEEFFEKFSSLFSQQKVIQKKVS